jgi:hypothetical protein
MVKILVSILGLSTVSLISFAAIPEAKITRNQYIETWQEVAVYQMAAHKIPASITLAQGILESGDGNSELARVANNHFGIKCHSDWSGEKVYYDDDAQNECFRKYRNARDSYEDHSAFLKRKRYESLFALSMDDYVSWAKGLKSCGYATNPNYAQLLIQIVEDNKLYEFDREGMHWIKEGTLPNGENLPVASRSDSGERNRKKGKNRNQQDGVDIPGEVTLGSSRDILVSGNQIKYIIVQEGDNFNRLAEELGMMPWQFRKYNDLKSDSQLSAGDMLYLQPKRAKSREKDYHTVKAGETIVSISQQYGVKIKHLLRKNGMSENSPLAAGTRIQLR